MNAQQALLGCSSAQLARIAAAWDVQAEPGTLRRELAELVAARMLDRVQDPAHWAALDASARDVLGQVVRAGGRHEADLLVRRLVRDAFDGGGDVARRRIDAAMSALVENGLLFRVFEADEQRQGVYLLLPDDLMSAARAHLGITSRTGGLAQAEPPARPTACNLAHDLFILASALRREAWGAASRGLARQPARSVGQILTRLRRLPEVGPGDPGRRWRFLLWVAQRAGWISRDPLPRPDDDLLERLLMDPSALPALALSAGPVSTGGRPAATERATPRRHQADALHLLGELEDGGWWQSGQVVSWISDELGGGSGLDTAGRSARAGRPEALIERWLAGRWFWLGLVAWGGDGTTWSVIAATPALKQVIGGQPAERQILHPEPCALSVEDGRLTLVAPAGADLAALYRCEPFLSLQGGNQQERRYALTPASFDRGVRLGGEAEDLRALLARLAGVPPGAAWLDAIDGWERGANRLRLSAQLLLTSDSERALAEATARPDAQAAIVEALTPRHVVVAGTSLPGLLADLATAGLPVEIDPGLRVEPANSGRASGLANGVAETAWVVLEALRRLAPDVVAEQRDLQAARAQLETVLAASRLEVLGRRAATLGAAIADRRRARSRRRVV